MVCGFAIRSPALTISAIACITLFFAWHIKDLSFRTSIYDLVIEGHPASLRYQEFKELFGSDEIIRIVIRSGNVFDPSVFDRIKTLSQACSQFEGVKRVISLPAIKEAIDLTGNLPLSSFAKLISSVELFQRNLISEDRKTTAITLVIDSETDKDRLIEKLEGLIRSVPKGISVYQIGIPIISKALAEYTRQDFLNLPPITLIVIAIILWLLYRSITSLLLPLSCVVMAVIWTFGFMALVKIPLSMLTMIVPIFLIAVGTAYCLHLQTEYRSRLSSADGPKDRATWAMEKQAFPIFLAVITTVVGIGSLVINRINGIREFSLFSCFGMGALLIILLTYFPAMLSILPLSKAKGFRKTELDRLIERLLRKVVTVNLVHQKPAILIIATMAAISAGGIFFISVETNPLEFFKQDTPENRHFHDIYKDLSGSFPVNSTVTANTDDFFEQLANVEKLARIQEFMDAIPGVDKTISFADYLKLVNYVKNGYDPKYYALPEEQWELRMLINNFKIILGADFLKNFMNSSFSIANILLLTHLSSSVDFLDLKKKIEDYFKTPELKELSVEVTGIGMVISASSRQLTLGQVKSLSIALVLIFFIMVGLFLSGKVGMIALIPNIFPIIVNFGIMGLIGIDLSVATSLIASIAIGLAVDNTIHYLVCYNNEFKKDLDKDRALTDTIMRVGKPVIFTAITIGLGFSILMFSHFEPTAIFGLMMVITMCSALVGDLILLPSLMLHVELVTAWDLLKLMPSSSGVTPGIAHELNQPLNAIKVGSEFLNILVKKGGEIKPENLGRVAEEISRQVDRASGIIQRLSAVNRKPDLIKEIIDLNDPIRDALAIMENQLKLDNIEVELNLSKNNLQVEANRNKLVQVTLNLLNNAWEAIALREDNESALRVVTIATVKKNNTVFFTISDSGIGMPAHLKDRVFEPFFTTKGPGKGMGLGLTISRQIIRDFGGRLEISSTYGSGTTIRIKLPAVTKELTA